MEKIAEQTKEQLLQTLWNDKKGKRDGGSQALFVGLSSPHPNLSSITQSMLEQLSDSPNGFLWARSWGRLAITVRPGFADTCLLANSEDDITKNFIPVSTTRIISPVGLIAPLPQGELATIFLNSQRATVEAILISYLHMVDELIWDLCRQQGVISSESYRFVVEQVKTKGFNTRLSSEDEILEKRLTNPDISVRLYGSGVNKFVPKVMGAIDFTAGQKIGSERLIDHLNEGSAAQLSVV